MAKSKLLIFLFALVFLTSFVSALTVINTTHYSSGSGSTIFVDRVVLDQVVVTATETTYENVSVTSSGSNFTNTNATTIAAANFINLPFNFSVLNKFTGDELFISTLLVMNGNVTWDPNQTITLLRQPIIQSLCTPATKNIMGLVVLFGALALAVFTLLLLFMDGDVKVKVRVTPWAIIVVFIGIIIAIAILGEAADNIDKLCVPPMFPV